jgi:surfactin family lipopeptide synthetase A
VSVSGNGMKEGFAPVDFTENDHDVGQIWENNIYVKSKFLAEKLVLDAKNDGMDAKIFRVGRLVGRTYDGKFQINPLNNVFYLLVKGILQIGAIPKQAAEVRTDVMPVDLCAAEVMALRSGESTVYHVMSFDPPRLGDIIKATDPSVSFVDSEDFAKLLRENGSEHSRELFAVVISNLNEDASRIPGANVKFDITQSHLREKGFKIPEISLETVFKSYGKGEQL